MNTDIKTMTVKELVEESKKQYEIEREAKRRAESCEAEAVAKFLREHSLDGVVLHKPTGKKGVLHKNWDIYRGLVVEFYPLKKNGEESMNKSLECTEWVSCWGLERNFERFPEVYEPVKEE